MITSPWIIVIIDVTELDYKVFLKYKYNVQTYVHDKSIVNW